jgi:hypothetical protein
MKNASKFAAVIGLGLALAPWTVAQATTDQPATQTVVVAIPQDQQPTKEQLAKLFEVMRLRQQLQSVMKTMPAMIQQQVQAQSREMAAKIPGASSPTPAQQAAIDKLTSKYLDKALNIYPVDELIEDMSGIYQRHLSSTDVDAFIAFYGSPAGQHLLDAQPAIMQEYMPVVMDRMKERSKALTDEMAQDMAALAKSQTPEPAADKPAAK